jgi:hypothetical protein
LPQFQKKLLANVNPFSLPKVIKKKSGPIRVHISSSNIQPRRAEAGLHNEGALEREATVDVARGFYLLRYASGAATGASPVAMVRPAQGSERFVEVISAPGVVTGFLSYPGECVVVRAEQAGGLSVKIMRQNVGASLDASFRLEPIFDVDRPSATTAANVGPSVPVVPPSGGDSPFRLLAHVARRGDVEVGSGEWIAGPNAPAAIEGVEVRGSLRPGLRIEVQPLVATNPPRWLDWTPAGVFAGSRGRALPLFGLRLRLSGEEASRFVLSAEALFLGSPIEVKRGREVELVGAAGSDPLVGLKLAVAESVAAGTGFTAPSSAAFAPQRSEPRVRVFRAAAGA